MKRTGFTLIELLIVVAIIAMLVAILLPALAAAREKATVVRASAELRLIGDAIDGYSMANNDKVPPGRTYCESDKANHWCDLPTELTKQNWIHKGSADGIISSGMLDIFNPGHTYKYMAPGKGFHNDAMVPQGIWVPDEFPRDRFDANPATLAVKYYDNFYDPLDASNKVIPCPVKWAIWSLGPRYDANEGSPKYAPVARCSWYRGSGTKGVIPRIRTSEGETIAFP
jgi:prepilin-type N-terminal cleavage/methylation domain-containing protein